MYQIVNYLILDTLSDSTNYIKKLFISYILVNDSSIKSAGNDFKAHCQHYKKGKRGRAFRYSTLFFIITQNILLY